MKNIVKLITVFVCLVVLTGSVISLTAAGLADLSSDGNNSSYDETASIMTVIPTPVQGTSATFYVEALSTNTKVYSRKRVANIISRTSTYDNRYKYIDYETFSWVSGTTPSTAVFNSIEYEAETGFNYQVDVLVNSISGVTNTYALGGMGSSNVPASGIEEYLAVSARSSASYPFLSSSYWH